MDVHNFAPHEEKKETQRGVVLQLLKLGPVTTTKARAAGVMHPAGRVKELRAQGYSIHTGKRGRMACYVLRGAHHAG